LLRGLADIVNDSQMIFRAVVDAMAHPGRIVQVPGPLDVPPPLHPAAAAVCLALVDLETSLWLDPAARSSAAVDYLRFHSGAVIVDTPATADFALIADTESMPALAEFPQGTDEEPERSATLIIQVASLDVTGGRRLTGPGIATEARLRAGGLPSTFWSEIRDNHAAFPRGVDLMLVAGARLAALLRTTRAED
jgi:alpha-D-ribose 1-methylphosphonate 5-triphosphate synthase subunit PhnH